MKKKSMSGYLLQNGNAFEKGELVKQFMQSRTEYEKEVLNGYS